MEQKKEEEKENRLFPAPKKKLPKPKTAREENPDDSMGRQSCHDKGPALPDALKEG